MLNPKIYNTKYFKKPQIFYHQSFFCKSFQSWGRTFIWNISKLLFGIFLKFCLKYHETFIQNIVFFNIAKNLLGILRNFCLKYSNFLFGISSKLLLGIARKFVFVISFNILFKISKNFFLTSLNLCLG